MKYRITTRDEILATLTENYDAIENIVAECVGPGTVFDGVTAPDHIAVITAELIKRDAGLLVEIDTLRDTGDEQTAREMIEGSLMGLAAIDRDLFERPITDLRELYRLTVAVESGRPDATPPASTAPYDGKIGRGAEDERWFMLRDRMDWPTRRRWQYHLRKEAKAKARRKVAKASV